MVWGEHEDIKLRIDEKGLRWISTYGAKNDKCIGVYSFKAKSFGFGPEKKRSRRDALESALSWLWWKHHLVTGEMRPDGLDVASIDDHEWEGVLDPREEKPERASKRAK